MNKDDREPICSVCGRTPADKLGPIYRIKRRWLCRDHRAEAKGDE